MADTTEKTVASELREAAEALRAGAAAARRAMDVLPGPEYPTVDAFQVALNRQFPVSRGMCEHIARWTPEAAEALASWLDLAAGRYDEDVYEDEIGCNPGGTHGDFCEADCPGHKPVAICDRCGNRVDPDAPEGSRCGCWDKALAVARVLNGTTERSTS